MFLYLFLAMMCMILYNYKHTVDVILRSYQMYIMSTTYFEYLKYTFTSKIIVFLAFKINDTFST